MAKKGPMPTFKTIDDYIAHQPENVQGLLQELRAIIKEAAPDAQEMLNYKVPVFTLIDGGKRDQQIMFAGYKNYVSLYPFPSTLAKFKNQLKGYKLGKGSVQFPLDQPLPKDIIIEMVKYRRAEILGALES